MDVTALAKSAISEAGRSIWNSGAASVAKALGEFAPGIAGAAVAGAGTIVWLPELAGARSDALPIDVAAVEFGLREVAHGIDSLTQQVLSGTSAGSGVLRVSAVAAFVAGTQLLLIDRKKPKGGPLLVFNTTRSSWSWLLGVGTRQRP
jgi:hypothetical protein